MPSTSIPCSQHVVTHVAPERYDDQTLYRHPGSVAGLGAKSAAQHDGLAAPLFVRPGTEDPTSVNNGLCTNDSRAVGEPDPRLQPKDARLPCQQCRQRSICQSHCENPASFSEPQPNVLSPAGSYISSHFAALTVTRAKIEGLTALFHTVRDQYIAQVMGFAKELQIAGLFNGSASVFWLESGLCKTLEQAEELSSVANRFLYDVQHSHHPDLFLHAYQAHLRFVEILSHLRAEDPSNSFFFPPVFSGQENTYA